MTGIVLCGRGRMGAAVEAAIASTASVTLRTCFGAHDPDPPPPADVVIDFSRPAGTQRCVAWCANHGIPLVSGTSALTADHWNALHAAARRVAVLHAANFSPGFNHLLWLLPQLRERLGAAFDIHIVETHHRHKADAPSGTALALQAALSDGSTAATADIGMHSIRCGEVVGRHALLFGGPGETVTITHDALSRATFAHGALQAATWLARQPAGLYDMQDVLASAQPA